jgi:hypothetical protein
MTLSGTRGIIRVSKNPACELQAAMAVERVREPDFYQSVTGNAYPREYGERVAARRRGHKFETRLHENNAAELRRVVGEHRGVDPEGLVVRDFAEEVPGPPTTMRSQRLARTRRVMTDLANGGSVPDILIQPQFALPLGAPGAFEYVSPDFAMLRPDLGMYVPGEEKSFIVRANRPEPADLDLTRRQAAIQILALRAEARLVALHDRVTKRAVFVMATPYGLRAAPIVEEHLDAAIIEVERAIERYMAARQKLDALRSHTYAPLEMLVDELDIAPCEECHRSCVMGDYCFPRAAEQPIQLGDRPARFLGTTSISRVEDLLAGRANPAGEDESVVLAELLDATQIIGIDRDALRRRLA